MVRVGLFAMILLAVASAAYSQSDPDKAYGGRARVSPAVERASLPTAGSRPRVTSEIRLGDRAPDFELQDASGARVRLQSLRGQWVALFFVDRRDAVPPLGAVQRDLEARGIRVVAVCAEKPSALRRVLAEHPADVLALSDPMSDVAALYGLFDSTQNMTRPGLVLLGIDGTVKLALMGQTLPPEDATRIVQYAVDGL